MQTEFMSIASPSRRRRGPHTAANLGAGVARRCRLLHAITPSRVAGAETLLTRLLARQISAGHDTHAVLSRKPQIVQHFRALDLGVTPLPISGKFNPRALVALRREVHARQVDVLHSHLSTASWWCGWLEKIGGPPSLGHVHGFTSALWHRRQRHLITCSAAVRTHLLDQGIAADRVTALPNPVDPLDVMPSRSAFDVRAEFGTDANTPVVGCFAHFSRKKGWLDLIAAAPDVLKSQPRAQFWCVGDGPLAATLKAEVARLRIAKNFRFPGFRSDVADIMNAVDVMCLASHREPFGLVYVEAGLLSKPVIGCRAGGAPEVIVDRESGVLVDPHSPRAIAESISMLIADASLSQRLGQTGRSLALERFGWPRYLASLDEIYERLMEP